MQHNSCEIVPVKLFNKTCIEIIIRNIDIIWTSVPQKTLNITTG